MKNIIVFNGIHASGKSTLSKKLAQLSKKFIYFPEIGTQLRSKVTFSTLDKSEEFDLRVIKKELKRDNDLIKSEYTPIVETWHFGNLAYILQRSPQLYQLYAVQINKQLKHIKPKAFLVTINWQIFKKRATDVLVKNKLGELQDFFDGILRNTIKIYENFNIDYIIIPNEGTIKESLTAIKNSLNIKNF